MDLDGSVVDGRGNASPVLYSERFIHAEIYRMNADGSNVIRLTTLEEDTTSTDGGPGNGNPSWSPFLEGDR